MSDIEYSVITSDVIKSFDCTDLDFNHCPLYCMEALPGLVASPVFLYSSGSSRFPQELCISVNIGQVKQF